MGNASFDPNNLAIRYYFGDLQYWKLPSIAAEALERGYDGIALRKLATLENPVDHDLRSDDIDSAFREMGVLAPITKDVARLTLAVASVTKALNGHSNIFDEATHIRIHLCELGDPAPELRQIVRLSQQMRNAPKSTWNKLETELRDAMSSFLREHGR